MKGEKILQVLVRETRDGLYDRENGTAARTVTRRILGDSSDARIVTARLQRLESVGLVERSPRPGYWKPTARGIEVDAILDRIVAARGGRFEPWLSAWISSPETYALQK